MGYIAKGSTLYEILHTGIKQDGTSTPSFKDMILEEGEAVNQKEAIRVAKFKFGPNIKVRDARTMATLYEPK